MSQDRVACYCNTCNEQVCLSINEWTPINDRYFTYEDPLSYKQTCLDLDFEIDEFEQLQGWTFRVLRCGHCGLNLGRKSLVAPKEKEEYQYVGIHAVSFSTCLLIHYSGASLISLSSMGSTNIYINY